MGHRASQDKAFWGGGAAAAAAAGWHCLRAGHGARAAGSPHGRRFGRASAWSQRRAFGGQVSTAKGGSRASIGIWGPLAVVGG